MNYHWQQDKKKKLRNEFNNHKSTVLKLSKPQISKLIQFGGFLGSLLNKLTDPLMKVPIPSAKKFLASLGITEAASPIDPGILKKIHGFGTTTLIVSNKETNCITKIIQAFEDSNILFKGVTKTTKNETKKTKRRILKHVVGYFGYITLVYLKTYYQRKEL